MEGFEGNPLGFPCKKAVRADRPLVSVAVHCAILGAVVALAALPLYVWAEPSWRPLVARLAAGLVLGVAILQFRRVLIERAEAGGSSPLDAARFAREAEAGIPHHLVELASDVRTARRSRRYFEAVMWPRLEALAGRPLTTPPRRRGRGPTLADLRRIIGDIEARP